MNKRVAKTETGKTICKKMSTITSLKRKKLALTRTTKKKEEKNNKKKNLVKLHYPGLLKNNNCKHCF